MSEPGNGKQLMSVGGEEEENCPGKMAGRKALPVQISDDRDISMLRAWLSLGDEECPLLGVNVLSHAP